MANEMEYTPTKQEESFLKFINEKLYKPAVEADKQPKKEREDNRRFYRGDQWRRRQPRSMSKSVSNFLSLIVNDETALLTDQPPNINVRPVDQEGDQDTAYILRKLILHNFYINKMEELVHKAVKRASGIDGVAYFYPYWDAEANQGEGEIDIRVERAENVLRDPSGENNYFIIEREVTLADIYRYYPDKAMYVKEQASEKKGLFTQLKARLNPVTSTDGSMTAIMEEKPSVMDQYQRVKLWTVWMRDDAIEKAERKEKNDKGVEETITEFNPKYKYGRWVNIANEKILLKDEPCKIKHMPIVPVILCDDPDNENQGISTIQNAKQSQVDYNEMYALLKDFLRLNMWPKLIYDKESGIDPKKIIQKPKMTIPKSQGTEVRFESPPSPPAEAFRFLVEGKGNIEYITGLTDVSQGRRPIGVEAAEAIRLLQEASKTLMRPKARLLALAIKDLAILIIDYIQYAYSVERIVRIMGGEETMTLQKPVMEDGSQVMTQQIQTTQPMMPGQQVNPQDIVMQNGVQMLKKIQVIKSDLNVGQYDVYVESDSTLPVSRIERFEMLVKLAELGFVDRESILEESGLPQWKDIERRMKEKEQQLQAQQEQQMQMQAQGQQQAAAIEQQKAQVEAQQGQAELALKEAELAIQNKEAEARIKQASRPRPKAG